MRQNKNLWLDAALLYEELFWLTMQVWYDAIIEGIIIKYIKIILLRLNKFVFVIKSV